MNAEQANNVVELYDESAQLGLSKALAPYSDNLPYDRNRVIQEAKMCLAMDIQLRYEIGRRLILLRENEGATTLSHILEEHFPGLNRKSAERYMRFARTAAALPKFQAFANGRDNWSKALAILEAIDEDGLAEFEEGSILGIPVETLDTLSVRELKTKIKKLEKAKDEAVSLAVDKYLQENVDLRTKVETLEAQVADPDIAAAEKLLATADKRLMEAMQCIRKIPWAIVTAETTVRDAILSKCELIERLAADLERRVLASVAEDD